jgi:hypothetical protein
MVTAIVLVHPAFQFPGVEHTCLFCLVLGHFAEYDHDSASPPDLSKIPKT